MTSVNCLANGFAKFYLWRVDLTIVVKVEEVRSLAQMELVAAARVRVAKVGRHLSAPSFDHLC